MSENFILLLDTQNKSESLKESFKGNNIEIEDVDSSTQFAQHFASGSNTAAIANIHNNDEFELLEHISKISLTFPEIPIVLLLPEPIKPSLNWGPKVFAIVKPATAYAILKRLKFLDSSEFPNEGILKRGMMLSLLDHCLLEKKSFRITIEYGTEHSADLLIRNGKWVSLYIDDSLSNDRLLVPFAWLDAKYKVEETSNAEVGEFEISQEEYQQFRKDLHTWFSLLDNLPDLLKIIKINKKKFEEIFVTFPENINSIVPFINGQRDLIKLFLIPDFTPIEIARKIGYLYYSDVLIVKNSSKKDSNENSEQSKKRKRKKSKDLATWLMDPLAAAKQLEKKLKKDIQKNRVNTEEKQKFRPRRKTQPGLGKLVQSFSPPVDIIEEKTEENWENGNSEATHEFAKNFAKGTSQENIFNHIEDNSIPISINDEITSKVEPRKGNTQSEKSGVFKVVKSEEGNVKEIVNENIDDKINKTVPGMPAIIISEETKDVVIEQDYENQELQSGVIEFNWKNRVSSKKNTIIDEIKEVSQLKETKNLGKIDIKEDEKSITSLNELQALREERKSDGYSSHIDSEETDTSHLSNKYKAILENLDKNSSSETEELWANDKKTKSLNEEEFNSQDFEDNLNKSDENFEDEDYDLFSIENTEEVLLDDIETFRKDKKSGGMTKYLVLIAIIGLAVIVYMVKFRKSENKVHNAKLKKSINSSMKVSLSKNSNKKLNLRKKTTFKKPLKKPAVKKSIEPPKPTPEELKRIAEKKAKLKLLGEINPLFIEYNKKHSRKLYLKIKSVFLKNNIKIPDIMGKIALMAYDYEGELKFAIKLSTDAVKINPNISDAWWVLGCIAYEKKHKDDKIKAFSHYFKLRPNDNKRKKLAKKMGFK